MLQQGFYIVKLQVLSPKEQNRLAFPTLRNQNQNFSNTEKSYP